MPKHVAARPQTTCVAGQADYRWRIVGGAFANIAKRLLEASGRGLWDAGDERRAVLMKLFEEMDTELETAPGSAGGARR